MLGAQSQVRQDKNAACAPASPMVRYWVRSVQPADGRRPNDRATCTSPGGRSEFFANTIPAGPGAHSVSHRAAA